ncbi:MAG: hypothetical protein IJ299_00395 [Oscillospiraceae bacterium]|nr:hypothetical protein [Oscillospiraceae bacterium]
MNGIDNITKRIEEEGECTVREIIAAAEADARAMRGEYDKKAEGIREKILARAEKDAESVAFRRESSAQAEARRASLAKKQELISAAFDEAVKKLSSLSGDKLVSTLATIALRAADGKCGELILSEKDIALKDKILEKCAENKGITVSEKTHSLGGGFIFKSGSTEINCTFPRLVGELRDGLSREIADILFG